MALRIQSDLERQMRQKEQEQNKMRFEWRKSCEQSYDDKIVEVRNKV